MHTQGDAFPNVATAFGRFSTGLATLDRRGNGVIPARQASLGDLGFATAQPLSPVPTPLTPAPDQGGADAPVRRHRRRRPLHRPARRLPGAGRPPRDPDRRRGARRRRARRPRLLPPRRRQPRRLDRRQHPHRPQHLGPRADLHLGSVDFALLGSLLCGSIPGVVAGSLLATRVPGRVLRPALALTLMVAGSRLVA